jgi:hypothetical protein
MEKSNNNFEEEWRKAFEDAEEQPDNALWQSIENKLAQRDIGVYKKKYYYTQVAAAVLLLLFLPLSAYFIYHFSNEGLAVRDNGKERKTEEIIETGSAENKREQYTQTDKIKTTPNTTVETGEILKESSASDLLAQKENNKTEGSESIASETLIEETNSASKQEQRFASGATSKSLNDLSETNSKVAIQSNNTLEGSVKTDGLAKLNTQKTNRKTQAGSTIASNKVNSSRSDNLTSVVSGDFQGIANNQAGETSVASVNEEIVNSNFELKTISGKPAQTKEVKPKPMYLYFWQNESLYVFDTHNKKEEKKKVQRWYANVDFAPSYTNQNFQSVASNNSPAGTSDMFFNSVARTTLDQSAKELEMLSKPQFSYTSGVNGAYRLNSKLSIEVGLKYVYSQAKVFTNYFVDDFNSNSQYPAFNMVLKEASPEQTVSAAYADNTEGINSNTVYNSFNKAPSLSSNLSSKTSSSIDDYKDVNIYTQYVGIPLTVNYKLIDKRLDISMGGGLSTDIFIQYGSKKDNGAGFESETIKRSDESVFKPYTFSFLISPEIEYGISSRSSIYIRPIYKGALHSFTEKEKLQNRPNSAGVGFGLRYNFK